MQVRLVVGTKVDQLARRQVTAEEGASWAADRDMLFLGELHSQSLYLECHEMSDTKEIVLIRNLSQEARWCGHCIYCPRGSNSPATSGTLCFSVRLFITHLQ